MSRFKSDDKGRFFITSITLHVMKARPQPPFYPTLQAYLDENGVTSHTPQTIRDAVIAIRSSKLPDPAVVANNGSFFFNPIVDKLKLHSLVEEYPDMPSWEVEGDKAKLSAAWLVSQAGFKGVHDEQTDMATWEKQPLVLVNESAKSTADLLRFKQKIVDAVNQKFGVMLVQEPELVTTQKSD
jgi:UDP-N-acetylmuramate dehydrogenase